jgi:hypothetical protein
LREVLDLIRAAKRDVDLDACRTAWIRLVRSQAIEPTHAIVRVDGRRRRRTHSLRDEGDWVEGARRPAWRVPRELRSDGTRIESTTWLDQEGTVWRRISGADADVLYLSKTRQGGGNVAPGITVAPAAFDVLLPAGSALRTGRRKTGTASTTYVVDGTKMKPAAVPPSSFVDAVGSILALSCDQPEESSASAAVRPTERGEVGRGSPSDLAELLRRLYELEARVTPDGIAECETLWRRLASTAAMKSEHEIVTARGRPTRLKGFGQPYGRDKGVWSELSRRPGWLAPKAAHFAVSAPDAATIKYGDYDVWLDAEGDAFVGHSDGWLEIRREPTDELVVLPRGQEFRTGSRPSGGLEVDQGIFLRPIASPFLYGGRPKRRPDDSEGAEFVRAVATVVRNVL